jgi:hypothetical protein
MNEINKTSTGTIDYISPSFSGKYIISIKLNKYISEVAGLRITNIDLVVKHYEGLKVPISSLKDVDLSQKKAKIIIVDANYAKIKDVSIIGYDSVFAIINNLKEKDKNGIGLYDVYVVKPGNIKEGQIIN